MTFIDFYTGEIISWDNFYIPQEEINKFNIAVEKYSKSTKLVPNTWELANICFKNGHLEIPTLEEFKSVPIITEEITEEDYAIWKFSEPVEKKETFMSKISDIIFILVCLILPPIALIILFFGY